MILNFFTAQTPQGDPYALLLLGVLVVVLVIYMLAGAFANVAGTMGAKDATVNLGLALVPPALLAAGLFVIAAFFGTATGTSMGTISALIPIAIGVAEKGNLSTTIVIAAV